MDVRVKIVGLVLPWETHFLPKVISSFISCKAYLTDKDAGNIKFSLAYSNVPDQIDWENALATPEYTENVFTECCELLSRYYDVDYVVDDTIGGCVGHRRREFEKDDYDFCVTFDCDMNFPSNLLKVYSELIKSANPEESIVLTPQIPVMWDDTWKTVTVHPASYRHEYYKRPDRFNIDLIQPDEPLKVQEYRSGFKWYGGMFPCYSKQYLHKYPLHNDLGNGYGPDDYYLMMKAEKNGGVRQFVVENLVVENSKQYWGVYSTKNNYPMNYWCKRISDSDLVKLI